ncbi:MAG: alpha-D-glucose phosphate-specific phosphoglucomutase [Halocynthiibacter sp.]
MSKKTHTVVPIEGQRPGTSGLRKKTRIFSQAGYLENYVQAIIDGTGGASGKRYVLGGDGRFFNAEACQVVVKMLAANGAREVIIGRGGLLSTPAASHLIRKNAADGGFILSASHNPGGEMGDFGLKFNGPNGGPATEQVTDAIVAAGEKIAKIHIWDAPKVSLTASSTLGPMAITIVDPVEDYAKLMKSLFDFDAISALFASGFSMRFDAMHAVTGPYAKTILEDMLGAEAGTVLNGTPLIDFGGGHPDPNPVWAKPLYDLLMSDAAPDFAAASDGDGDRNMILGRGTYVSPSDSLAVLAANAHHTPAFSRGFKGVARSMPTSRAVDRVAQSLSVESFSTPTGWKFFGNLLDAGRVSICGEESAGTGSDHVREKDGLWAVLLWLNILAVRKKSVSDILHDHWSKFGRDYYTRHDFETIETAKAEKLMSNLDAALDQLVGQVFAGHTVTSVQNFAYDDPVDGSRSENQGIIIGLSNDARVVFRLSGTGTQGATLRVYMERFDRTDIAQEVQEALATVIDAAYDIAKIEEQTGRKRPDVIT